jgi:hypothetical protein
MTKLLVVLFISITVSYAFACGGTKDDEDKKRFESSAMVVE